MTIDTSTRWKSVLLGAALGAALASTSSIAHAATIKIGLLAPLTGPASADGQEFQRGAQLAVDELNAAGGFNGDKFELVVGDVKDQSAGNVTSAVERLIGDPDVHFMLTGYASLTNFEIDTMAEADMPYIIAADARHYRARSWQVQLLLVLDAVVRRLQYGCYDIHREARGRWQDQVAEQDRCHGVFGQRLLQDDLGGDEEDVC
jgi:hypothetical protein